MKAFVLSFESPTSTDDPFDVCMVVHGESLDQVLPKLEAKVLDLKGDDDEPEFNRYDHDGDDGQVVCEWEMTPPENADGSEMYWVKVRQFEVV